METIPADGLKEMDETSEDKQSLRREMRARRSLLSAEEWERRSAEICFHLQSLEEFKATSVFHAFWPIETNREVDLRNLIRQAHSEGKLVLLPKINGALLDFLPFTGDQDLVPGPFGVLEPALGTPLDPSLVGLFLLPALALDKTGARLGYGGGYYDRMLRQMKCLKIAPAFDFQVIERVPVSSLDIPIDVLVTESGPMRVS